MAITSGVRQVRAFLTIGGQQISPESMSVKQEATDKSSTWDANFPLQLTGDDIFANISDNSISIMVDAGSGAQTLMKGELDHFDIDYEAGAVYVKGRDESSKLHDKRSSEKFNNKKRSEIVEEVAKRNGFSAQADSDDMMGGKKFQIDFAKMTDGVSDAAILHKMAELGGARWWVKDGKLYFKTGTQGSYQAQWSPPSSAQYAHSNCLNLNISGNVQAQKKIKVKVQSWHDKKKKVITSTKQSSGGVGGTLEFTFRNGGLEQDHADDLAKRKVKELTRHKVAVTATMIGDASIDIGMGLQVSGTAFDDTYEIQSIAHEIDVGKGYLMTIHAKSKGEDAE